MPDFSPKRIIQHYTLQLFLCSGLLTLSTTNFGEWARADLGFELALSIWERFPLTRA